MRTLKPIIVFALVSTLCVLRSLTAEEKLDLPGARTAPVAEVARPAHRAYPWQDPDWVRMRARLDVKCPDINFDAVSFEDCVSYFRELTQINIVVNWSALETAAIENDKEVSLVFRDVTYDQALRLLVEDVGGGETDLAYEIRNNVVYISTKEDLARITEVYVYNVRDLLDLAAKRMGNGEGNFPLYHLPQLISIIQQTVDPESWREAGGNVGAISDYADLLVITQTTTAHQQIWDLLENMRFALRQ